MNRVAFVDTALEVPPTGGCQTFLVDICSALKASAIEVHVLFQPGPEHSVSEQLTAAGVRLHGDLWSRWSIPEERAEKIAAWARQQSLGALVVSVSPDAGWLALPLLDPSIATITIAHSDGPAFYSPLAHYREFVDRAVGVSTWITEKIATQCGVPVERTSHIPYGIHMPPADQVAQRWNLPRPRPEILRLAYVGRLDQTQKRVRDLVALVSELQRRGVAFEVEVIGDGQEREWLRESVRALGMAEFVHFQGWLTPREVRQRLSTIDVLLLFSSTEGLPFALLEAMGHAVVPVVTDLKSGNAELVRDGECGHLVPVGQIRTFADRLERLAADPRELMRLSRNAWEACQQYSIERMTSSYIRLFDRIAVDGPGPRAPRPRGPFPLMVSCRSRYPRWIRKLKAGIRPH